MIITKNEFDYIKNKGQDDSFMLCVDFGTKKVEVIRHKNEASIDKVFTLNLDEKVKDNFCYLIDEKGLKKLAIFSEETSQFYKLTPTGDWPTISIGSVPMHKLSSPRRDAENKINLLKPYGIVLDTCMGLGYTAILAAHSSEEVITFERDANVIYLAKLNPLSKELFSANNIKIQEDDVYLAAQTLGNNYFDCIIHDPPTFKLSPELFSVSFYNELFRILKPGGRLFHYTPLYKIKRGFNFPQRIKSKLKEAKFKVFSYCEQAGGWLCKK